MGNININRQGAVILSCVAILIAGSLLQILYGYSYGDMSGHAWGSDDAYISYRYAKNFSDGNGLVFNPGERVEGYTNFLYVLIVSPIFKFAGIEKAYPFSVTLNLAFAIMAFFIFCRHIRNRFGGGASIISAILLALCPPIWAAVASGMETTLVLLVQMLIWIYLERLLEKETQGIILRLNIFLIFSLLVRADGFIIPLVVVLYLLLVGKRRAALACGVMPLLVMAGYLTWRYSYYGYLLPNTYYAKVSGPLFSRLLFAIKSLIRIAGWQGMLIWLSLPLYMILKTIVQMARRGIRSLALVEFEVFLAAGWLAYWIYVGGDIYNERFLLILIPLGISLLFKIFKFVKSIKAIAVAIALICLIQLIPLFKDSRFRYSSNKYDSLITLGRFLGEKYPGETLATTAAGKLPFYSGLYTIDMHGLTDLYLAHKPASFFDVPGHNKYDADYIISRSPRLIATFVNSNLNLHYGLDRGKYEKAGYNLRYLLNTDKQSRENDIIDVQSLDTLTTKRLIDEGYEFAVLEKPTGLMPPK